MESATSQTTDRTAKVVYKHTRTQSDWHPQIHEKILEQMRFDLKPQLPRVSPMSEHKERYSQKE